MGDPLSIAASVTGLITISAQIVGMAKELVDKVKDTPETMVRVREEVESMEPILCQVQLLLNGSGSGLSHANLTVISIHNLMATLTSCVIVYSKLEKMVNEVCGFNDSSRSSAAWKRAGVIEGRVKWGQWRHEEVLGIIEDLQRQKSSLNLMLTISTTTTESSDAQARLQELSTGMLQSSHAHSVLLRELISRQDEQARVLDDIRSSADQSTNMHTSTLAIGGSMESAIPSNFHNSSANASTRGRFPPDYDSTSIISKRSTFSLRSGRPTYMEDLKASRAYKRLRHFGLGVDPSIDSESVLSFHSGCSIGNWSMLSDMTLGDLSVSQIAVLNLPIDLADVSNPEPFQEPGSTGTHHSPPKPRRKWSSRGRLHNATDDSRYKHTRYKHILVRGIPPPVPHTK